MARWVSRVSRAPGGSTGSDRRRGLIGLWGLFIWMFSSWQHLRSYKDGYRLATIHDHGDFMVLPHWETTLLEPCLNFPLSHIILIVRSPIIALVVVSARQGHAKCQCSKSLLWLGLDSNSWPSTWEFALLFIWSSHPVIMCILWQGEACNMIEWWGRPLCGHVGCDVLLC